MLLTKLQQLKSKCINLPVVQKLADIGEIISLPVVVIGMIVLQFALGAALVELGDIAPHETTIETSELSITEIQENPGVACAATDELIDGIANPNKASLEAADYVKSLNLPDSDSIRPITNGEGTGGASGTEDLEVRGVTSKSAGQISTVVNDELIDDAKSTVGGVETKGKGVKFEEYTRTLVWKRPELALAEAKNDSLPLETRGLNHVSEVEGDAIAEQNYEQGAPASKLSNAISCQQISNHVRPIYPTPKGTDDEVRAIYSMHLATTYGGVEFNREYNGQIDSVTVHSIDELFIKRNPSGKDPEISPGIGQLEEWEKGYQGSVDRRSESAKRGSA